MSRVTITREETKTSCGTARIEFPENCSMPYLTVSFSTDDVRLLSRGICYGVRNIEPPGDFKGTISYILIIEALELLKEFFNETTKLKESTEES